MWIPHFGLIPWSDEKIDQNLVEKPQHATPDPLQLPDIVDMGDEFKAVLALYREAKNNHSPYYRFFCYYKILEAFYERSDIFRKVDQIIQEKKLSIKRLRRKITKDDLIYALVNPNSKYLNMPYDDFFKELRSNERLKVAHLNLLSNGKVLRYSKSTKMMA